MSAHNDGGPAFPREDYQLATNLGQCGMSLRDYFAAKALAGILAKEGNTADLGVMGFAIYCYDIADAMLRAREGKR